MRLAQNIESGDFSELPSPTLPISLTLGVLAILIAGLVGALALLAGLWRKSKSKRSVRAASSHNRRRGSRVG